ncbi:hypothetical protein BpHYR1_003738 [Brachionus plicatilis]|uniref:Uncharacterized protein n=1 Tax=Brachionus plicatilis TaxID=10195 RepID=A0A3M7QSY4_BRAPC|nr:hypothetical protein BpHYR1_003738 [Brachionus plicatilis]
MSELGSHRNQVNLSSRLRRLSFRSVTKNEKLNMKLVINIKAETIVRKMLLLPTVSSVILSNKNIQPELFLRFINIVI